VSLLEAIVQNIDAGLSAIDSRARETAAELRATAQEAERTGEAVRKAEEAAAGRDSSSGIEDPADSGPQVGASLETLAGNLTQQTGRRT
jgi:hypothetical protein